MGLSKRTETPVSVITGATSGLGKALADACAREHHHILGVGRNEKELEKLVARATDFGAASVTPVRADLATIEGRHDVIEASRALEGTTRYLFNVAGKYISDQEIAQEPGKLENLYEVKSSAAFDLLRAPYPELFFNRRSYDVLPWTAVVYSGSQAQLIDLPGSSHYTRANNVATMTHLSARLLGIDAKTVYFGNLEGTTADSFHLDASDVIPITTAANEMLLAAQDPSLVSVIVLPQSKRNPHQGTIQKRTLLKTDYSIKNDPDFRRHQRLVQELFSSMDLPTFG